MQCRLAFEIRRSRLASFPGSLYPRFLYGTPRSRCTDYRLRPWNRPGHRSTFCEGRRGRVSYRAHGKGTRLHYSGDSECRGTGRIHRGGFIEGSRLRGNRCGSARKVRQDRHSGEQCGALRPGGSGGRVSARGIRQGDCRSSSCGISAIKTRVAGDVLAAVRRNPEYLQPFRESRLRVGLGLCRGEGGMLGLTRVTAAEGARKGIRVNAICPGPVTETQMSKDLGAVLAKKMGVNEEEQLAGFLSGLLQGRAQTAEEIARAALFLCSKQSSAMTGQSINVDGGVAFY